MKLHTFLKSILIIIAVSSLCFGQAVTDIQIDMLSGTSAQLTILGYTAAANYKVHDEISVESEDSALFVTLYYSMVAEVGTTVITNFTRGNTNRETFKQSNFCLLLYTRVI